MLNWIIALGIIGDTPAEIVDMRESHTQLAFRVAAIWEAAHDPDGNGREVYYEEPGGYRGAWEGTYPRKLEDVSV